jgi:hypothetical protein
MPLAKKTKSSKSNQGAQSAPSAGPGNIHYLPQAGGTDKSGKKPMVNSKHGRNLAIGRK